MLELRIRLLGGFRVRVGPREIADERWRLRKSRNLVKLLALAPGHRLHREQVLAALWPELPPEAGANQLRKALHEARRTLDPDPSATHRYLESAESLALGPRGAVRVDVEEFEHAALAARRSRDPRAYERAVARYGGDLLPEDRYEEWAIEREQALRAEYLALLIELGGLREARADVDGAAAVLRRAVAADPLHEEASLALMRVYALAGRRHQALHEYDRLAAALDRDTDGVEGPGPAAQRLREQVRTGGDVRAELTGELWEQVGDLRMLSGDTAGAAVAYGSALEPGVVDLPASPGVATARRSGGA
ncbi:AfsR/SARP family transcriptional regulator, partial [Kitasatospora sp. NPDC004240]